MPKLNILVHFLVHFFVHWVPPSSPGLRLPCPLPLYKRESDWMSIQPIEDPDRYIHVFPAKLLVGVQIKNEIFRRGLHRRIRSGGEGAGLKKNLQI